MHERPGGGQPIERADVMPAAYTQPNEKFFDSAYGPMIAPAFEGPWRSCPPAGGRLEELSLGGGSWTKFPHAEKLLPLPNDFEIVNIGKCHPN